MSEVRMKRIDLSMELEKCHAMACFLSEAVCMVLTENGTYTTETVPIGAGASIRALADNIRAIADKI